jgi:type IV fimbrial biogenesis protein FimT
MRLRQTGITLIEMLIAMAILAILLAAATPSFRDMIMDNRISAQASELLADLALARDEAVKRHLRVVVCKGTASGCSAGASWGSGRIVFIDANADGTFNTADGDTMIKVVDALSGNNTLVDAPSTTVIAFRPSGAPVAATPTLKLCDSRTAANLGRSITIDPSGRVGAVKVTCP